MTIKTNAIRILERHQIDYELIHYRYNPDNLSVEKIAQENELALETIFKTLVAKGNKTGVIIAVVPGNKALDYKALARASANKNKICHISNNDLIVSKSRMIWSKMKLRIKTKICE